MRPAGALTVPVNADLTEASLEDSLERIGNPERFRIHVHPRSNHYASHIAFPSHHEPKTYKLKYEIVEHPDWNEYEWMVEDWEHEHMVWVAGC